MDKAAREKARGISLHTLRERFAAAWSVWCGNADALVWPEDQEVPPMATLTQSELDDMRLKATGLETENERLKNGLNRLADCDWKTIRDIVSAVNPHWSELPNGRVRQEQYEFTVAVIKEYRRITAWYCSHCKKLLSPRAFYRCWDCKSMLCEDCVLEHFGSGHRPHPKLIEQYEAEIAQLTAELKEHEAAQNDLRLATHRHKKRGTEYRLIGKFEIQASAPINEGDLIYGYVGEDGRGWARLVSEFEDGRFENIDIKRCLPHDPTLPSEEVLLQRRIAQLTAERDVALARIAELEDDPPDLTWFWTIVDRHGFREVPSDEPNALARICNALDRAKARIAELEAQSSAQFVAGMREALKDCADDLEAEIEERYRNCKEHPSMRVKYARDIEPVKAARAILAVAALKGEGE